jgi:hypothetical protein
VHLFNIPLAICLSRDTYQNNTSYPINIYNCCMTVKSKIV